MWAVGHADSNPTPLCPSRTTCTFSQPCHSCIDSQSTVTCILNRKKRFEETPTKNSPHYSTRDECKKRKRCSSGGLGTNLQKGEGHAAWRQRERLDFVVVVVVVVVRRFLHRFHAENAVRVLILKECSQKIAFVALRMRGPSPPMSLAGGLLGSNDREGHEFPHHLG